MHFCHMRLSGADARCRLLLIDSRRIRKEGERRRGGFSPSSRISWEMGPSRRMDRGGTLVTGGTRLGDALRSSWESLQGHAKVNTTDDYEGLLVEPATTGAVGRQL